MSQVRTFRFHVKYGPAPLFDRARERLEKMAGLNLEIPHAKHRFDEREIPLGHLTDFQPNDWELVTVEIAMGSGEIIYTSLRRKLGSQRYLWVVLESEYVITAWISEKFGNRATNPLNVKDGPAWEAAAQGVEPPKNREMAEWEQSYTRRLRAQRLLTTLDSLPERAGLDRVAIAARSVLAGSTWNEAAIEAGWSSRKGLDNSIARLTRAAKRARASDSGD